MLLSALVWARLREGSCKDARGEKNRYIIIIIEIVLPFLASYQYK